MKLNRQTIIFIGLSLILVAELFVFIPAGIARIRRNEQGINDLKEKISIVESEWLQKKSYLQRKEALRNRVESYQEQTILAGRESGLISYISENSQEHEVQIKSISPRDSFSSGYANFSYLPFRIEAESSSKQLIDFLNFLYQGVYFFELKELTLNGYNPSQINMVLWALRKN